MSKKGFSDKTAPEGAANVSDASQSVDPDFLARRRQARVEVNALDKGNAHDEAERGNFFNAVYDRANSDAAQIPWADLAPKPQLANWLKSHLGAAKSALDIACGLGDNAEAMADVGYQTTAFDVSDDAIEWAKKRFPASKVQYQTANLFEPPTDWPGAFDLVNECYTLQALPPAMLDKTAAAIAGLVKSGGILLVYTRLREDGSAVDGPPWPLQESDAMKFDQLGFELIEEERFVIERGERKIAHQFAQWRKTA